MTPVDVAVRGAAKCPGHRESEQKTWGIPAYRKRFGEIDIIAEKKGTVAFVEVKTRHENPLTRPFEAVDTKKQEKIYRTSLAYIYENDLDCQYRFDVCEVYVNRDTLKLIQINYFDNAFIPESDNGYY